MGKKIAFLVTAFAILVSAYPISAQEAGNVPRIGVLMSGTPKTHSVVVDNLRLGLRDLGYEEGRNILLEPRFAMNNRAHLAKLAKELLQLKVDVIVVTGATPAIVTRKASASIPIVVASARDLVASGIVASIARPGGNTTGNSSYAGDLVSKQLQLLKGAIPGLARVAVLYSTGEGSRVGLTVKHVTVAGRALGVEIQDVGVRNDSDFEGAFAAMAKARADALILIVSRLISIHRRELIKLAAKWKLPAMCWRPSMARRGCLLTYGADRNAMYRNAANFVHRILKGAKPSELPIEQPTKFHFIVNLKTAKALGITFPPSILLRADRVIE